MMNLEDLIRYICKNYPHPDELSKARITKLVYLADWESCKSQGKQITNIQWYFHNFGPYVDDVVETAKRSKYLQVNETENFYGEKKEIISEVMYSPHLELDRNSVGIINKVINETKNLYWSEFIEYVYHTAPVANSERHTTLNLSRFAKLYPSRGTVKQY